MCYNFLKSETDLSPAKIKNLVGELNTISDFLAKEKKLPILRKLLFKHFGFSYVSYEELFVNCWLLLREEKQICVLSKLSRVLNMDSFRAEAIKTLFVDVMHDGQCRVVDLNLFLEKHHANSAKVPNPGGLKQMFVSNKAKQHTYTIYNFIYKL